MDFSWPEFASNRPVDGGRSWTAAFDSYDQYRELCYYLVKIFDGDWQVGEGTAEVGTGFAGDDWATPAFESELRARIAQVAAALSELWGAETCAVPGQEGGSQRSTVPSTPPVASNRWSGDQDTIPTDRR